MMSYKSFQIKDILEFQQKSKHKAGEGLETGEYPFFTSSQNQRKWFRVADYRADAVILGTGGMPSVHFSAEFSTSTDVFILAPKSKNISAKYVAYYLTKNKDVLEKGFKGAGLKHLSRGYVEKLDIGLPINSKGVPDRAEQNRIVAILEEAETLKNKRAEADRKMEELVPALFDRMFGDPVRNPKGWKMVRLLELGTLDRGKSQHRPRTAPELFGGAYPFVQTGDVANAGWRITSYHQTYSDKGLAQSKIWPKDTLCITIAANIARTAILDFEACFPDSVVGFTSNKNSNPDFIQGVFIFLQRRLEEMAPRAAQLNINLAILRNYLVPTPPIALQNKFAEAVKEIEKQKEQQKLAGEKTDELFASLLGRYFSKKMNTGI
jgi:type I restriction enzyme S subunit